MLFIDSPGSANFLKNADSKLMTRDKIIDEIVLEKNNYYNNMSPFYKDTLRSLPTTENPFRRDSPADDNKSVENNNYYLSKEEELKMRSVTKSIIANDGTEENYGSIENTDEDSAGKMVAEDVKNNILGDYTNKSEAGVSENTIDGDSGNNVDANYSENKIVGDSSENKIVGDSVKNAVADVTEKKLQTTKKQIHRCLMMMMNT